MYVCKFIRLFSFYLYFEKSQVCIIQHRMQLIVIYTGVGQNFRLFLMRSTASMVFSLLPKEVRRK